MCLWRAVPASAATDAAATSASVLLALPDVLQLRFVARIPSRSLRRTDNEFLNVYGLCALTDDEVLLACGLRGLRALGLKSAKLSDPKPSALTLVYSVALDAATDTIVLALAAQAQSRYIDVGWLVSLQLVADEWREVQRLQIEISSFLDWVGLSFAGDSRVLLGQCSKDRLYAFDVSVEHRLQPVGAVLLEKALFRFACTRLGADSLVAIVHYRSRCVSVERLVGAGAELHFESLAHTELAGAWNVLFRGDHLLVSTLQTVVSFYVAVDGARLRGRRELLGASARVCVIDWCLAGELLVVRDLNSNDLLLYASGASQQEMRT